MSVVFHKKTPPLLHLALIHMGMASLVFLQILYQYWRTQSFQYLIFAPLAVLFTFLHYYISRQLRSENLITKANAMIMTALIMCALTITVFVHNSFLISVYFIAAVPLTVAFTGRLKQLPLVLFLTFLSSAVAILVDLALPSAPWRLMVQTPRMWIQSGIGFLCYLACLGLLTFKRNRHRDRKKRLKINVATQYALVFTGISAMAIILVTGVMIHQIRNAQIDQVGKSFETIAENFAKLVGSHLEQQTQKLQMLTQQVPIFRESLIDANSQYENRIDARRQLIEKNRLWEGPEKDNAFIMSYLNNSIIKALSRFRGHNSFHSNLVLVDGYGGLVAGLGKKPAQFYVFDQNWWKISWNEGLGNIFIGDLQMDKRTMIPKLRISVDIIDHSTNEVIGILSSTYLLRTLLEDIQRFKPDTVDQISLIDAQGRVIASTDTELTDQQVWSQLKELTDPKTTAESGWVLGRDHLDHAVLVGFSTLSTAYNVISDPLHRLGWHIVVSGTRTDALTGVTQSTKLATLVGLVAMALGVLAAIAAARVITRPIENLTATASAMSVGNLDNRAQLTGPEELVALSAGFNRLTDRLHRVIRNLKTQAKQLAKAKRGAEAATQLKGEFLANMSHEIRTPLNAILGFADILESSIEDKKQKRHAQTIKASGADLLHLINDILDLSKIEAGRMEIQMHPVSLRAIFSDLQRIFSIHAEEKNIELEMTVASELPKHLMLDRVRLRQVLFNLIGNAVKFTEEGHVQCIAKGIPTETDDTWQLTIEVQDTGIGIDPKAYADIFETFKQHQGESGATYEGTGLGLSISKSLIEMMGGHIDVNAQQDRGSIFTIHIPRVDTAHPSTFPVTDLADPRSNHQVCFEPANLLIADDLEVNRRLIVEALKPFPLEIHEAEHGQAAVDLAIKRQFDLILMDLRMPGIDGYSALRMIRHQLDGAAPCIIATTAAGMKEDIAKIHQAGFNDYLIRPFNKRELVQLLMNHLPHEVKIEQKPSKKSMLSMTAATINTEQPWKCPPEAEELLFQTLKHQWEQVSSKQSIPDIIHFANDVKDAGDRYGIELLSRYGEELAEYAEGFDIHNVEKLLNTYDVILSCRENDGRGEA